MRRLGSVLVGLLVFGLALWITGPAEAGDFHRGSTLVCSDCHVMHFSQQHGYNPDGSGLITALGPSGPYEYLLRNDHNNLCLTCHDGQAWAPDVLEDPVAAIVRQAGALNKDPGSGTYPTATGHTLDTTDNPPGNTGGWVPDATLGLLCVDCHDQHGWGGPSGYNQYRNLVHNPGSTPFSPGTQVSYNDTTPFVNDATKDVFQRVPASYAVGNVDFNEPDETASAYAAWCGGCHNDFHGGVGSSEIGGDVAAGGFVRHPVAGVQIGGIGGGHSSKDVFAYGPDEAPGTAKLNWVKVMSASGEWTPNDPGLVSDQTPSCMTCHKAHGNKNAFGLIYMSAEASGGITEEGTSGGAYKDLCGQCHVQGS